MFGRLAHHTYGVFLPKHRRGNAGGYTEYFLRNPDGSYSPIRLITLIRCQIGEGDYLTAIPSVAREECFVLNDNAHRNSGRGGSQF
jgi:hypothetical protein